jgi:hypothetical protein
MSSQVTDPGKSLPAPPGLGGPRAGCGDGDLRHRLLLPRCDAAGGWRRLGLVAIKTVHTIAFFGIGSCLGYLAYSGLIKRSDRRTVIAGAVVTGEALVYAGNGFRCPLTDLAERLGSEHASVADIYLPRWLESHLPQITGPIFVGALVLHARNLIESRRAQVSRRA